MEANFFAEIEKKMNVKKLKDFEKELRSKINNEFESLRKTNLELSRILTSGECEIWEKIRNDIYSNFNDMVDNVKELNKKVDEIKKLKDLPEPMDED